MWFGTKLITFLPQHMHFPACKHLKNNSFITDHFLSRNSEVPLTSSHYNTVYFFFLIVQRYFLSFIAARDTEFSFSTHINKINSISQSHVFALMLFETLYKLEKRLFITHTMMVIKLPRYFWQLQNYEICQQNSFATKLTTKV